MARERGRGRRMRTSREMQAAARMLRRQLTPAEQMLWSALRNRGLGGYKFRVQHPVGRFVLDLYCPERKLVVEVDGGVHDTAEQAERDAARTRHLAAFGYRVLRFRNEEVLDELPSVLDRILAAISEPMPAPTALDLEG